MKQTNSSPKLNIMWLVVITTLAFMLIIFGGKTLWDQSSSNQTSQQYTIDLYNLLVMLPQGWSVQEINRRPEPTGPGDPLNGHDCADYLFFDKQHLIELSLTPICGFGDSGSDNWPSDSFIVHTIKEGEHLIRYQIPNDRYQYGTGFNKSESKSQTPGLIVSKSGIGNLDEQSIFANAQITYSGPESQKEKFLKEADSIITSLKVQ